MKGFFLEGILKQDHYIVEVLFDIVDFQKTEGEEHNRQVQPSPSLIKIKQSINPAWCQHPGYCKSHTSIFKTK